MEAKGHESVSEISGIPVLKANLTTHSAGVLHCLYLGNWLSDHSQLIDPVSMYPIPKALEEVIISAKLITEDLLKISPYLTLDDAITLNTLFSEYWLDKIESIKYLVAPYNTEDELSFGLYPLIKLCVFFKGYTKFVTPEMLTLETYNSIFSNKCERSSLTKKITDCRGRFSQYYAHEHYDRPEIFSPDKTNKNIYADFQNGTQNKYGTYTYLRYFIENTAGLLTEADMYFQRYFEDRSDEKELPSELSRLGHALHQVEDFFAHSNWMELYFERYKQNIPFTSQEENEILVKRRTKYNPDNRNAENETNIVTGYFNRNDTIISILHAFGIQHTDQKGEAGRDLDGFKEFLDEPLLVQFRSALTKCFEYLKEKWNKIEKDITYEQRVHLDKDARRELFKIIDKELNSSVFTKHSELLILFVEFFNFACDSKKRFDSFVNLLELFKNIDEFLVNPLLKLEDILKGVLKDSVIKLLLPVINTMIHDKITSYFDQYRIGSHSLLSKDINTSVFYNEQKNCAIIIHNFIMTQLMRWPKYNMSLEPEDPQITVDEFIDWNAVLRQIFRNPLSIKKEEDHWTKGINIHNGNKTFKESIPPPYFSNVPFINGAQAKKCIVKAKKRRNKMSYFYNLAYFKNPDNNMKAYYNVYNTTP